MQERAPTAAVLTDAPALSAVGAADYPVMGASCLLGHQRLPSASKHTTSSGDRSVGLALSATLAAASALGSLACLSAWAYLILARPTAAGHGGYNMETAAVLVITLLIVFGLPLLLLLGLLLEPMRRKIREAIPNISARKPPKH